MAKKPRTQVDYNPGQASLQGGVGASEGNYRVAVAPTPKTNAALQFASFINQIPNVAGQYTNYIEAIGQEKLAMMTEDELEQELAGGDKETLNILKYNKAYNYGLVEKNFKRNVEAYQKRFNDMAGMIENYADNDTFLAAMDDEAAAIGSEFLAKTANEYQRKAGEALLFNTLPTLRAKSLEKYQAYKQDATIQNIQSTIHDEVLMNKGNLPAGELLNFGLRKFKNSLSFPDLTPTDKSRLMEQFVYGLVSRYEAIGGEGDAVDVLDAASVFEIYPGAKLGSIGDNATQFERLKASLLEVDTEKGETQAQNRSRVSNSAKTAYRTLHIGEVDKEGIAVDMDTLVDTVATHENEEWKQAALQQLMEQIDLTNPSVTERSGSLANGLRLLKGSTENERTRDLLDAAVGEVEPAQDLYMRKTILDPAGKEQLQEVVTAYVSNDPFAPIPDKMRVGDKEVAGGSAQAIKAFKEARKELPWLVADKPSDPLLAYFKKLADTVDGDVFDDFTPVIESRVTNHLRSVETNNKAWAKAEGNIEAYKAQLDVSTKEFLEGQKREYILDQKLDDLKKRQEKDVGVWDVNDSDFLKLEDEIREAVSSDDGPFKTVSEFLFGGDAVEGFESLKEEFNGSASQIKEDRKKLLKVYKEAKGKDEDISIKALAYSVQKFGFNSLLDFDQDILGELRRSGDKGENYPVIYISKVPIGDSFKGELFAALQYATGISKDAKFKKAYELVVEHLSSDKAEEIQWWIDTLKNN